MCELCNKRVPLTKFILIPEYGKEWTGNQYRVDVGSKLYRDMVLTLGDIATSYEMVSDTLDSKKYVFRFGHKHMTLTFAS